VNKRADRRPQSGDALLIIDPQNDFLPGGGLAVPGGDEVIKPINQAIFLFCQRKLPLFITRDWHPLNHGSFRGEDGIWPPHCVAGSHGALFSPDLQLPPEITVISKGTDKDVDGYSGFEGTDLEALLKKQKIRRVFIGGLATDYCVLNTVRDAIKRGFQVFLLRDSVRAVNVTPGDGDRALAEMKSLGVNFVLTGDLAA
jgi:nicotinamidase-related amidase